MLINRLNTNSTNPKIETTQPVSTQPPVETPRTESAPTVQPFGIIESRPVEGSTPAPAPTPVEGPTSPGPVKGTGGPSSGRAGYDVRGNFERVTRPRIGDTPEAEDARAAAQDLNEEANELAQQGNQYLESGVGQHTLDDGTQVNIEQGVKGKSGGFGATHAGNAGTAGQGNSEAYTVTVTHADGSTEQFIVNPNNPDNVSYTETDADGNRRSVGRNVGYDGITLTETLGNEDGFDRETFTTSAGDPDVDLTVTQSSFERPEGGNVFIRTDHSTTEVHPDGGTTIDGVRTPGAPEEHPDTPEAQGPDGQQSSTQPEMFDFLVG